MQNENEIIEKLTAKGGKLWEKNGMRRIYFDAEKILDMKINRYNTGNICFAALGNEKISNSEAYRILNVKIWFDLDVHRWHTTGADKLQVITRDALKNFMACALS